MRQKPHAHSLSLWSSLIKAAGIASLENNYPPTKASDAEDNIGIINFFPLARGLRPHVRKSHSHAKPHIMFTAASKRCEEQ